MNNIKESCKQCIVDWFSLIERFGSLSTAIKSGNQEQIQHYLIIVINMLLNIAKYHDIDMNKAWDHWRIKALSKIYD